MLKFIDLTGQVFGRLTVLRSTEHKRTLWICRCSCGNAKIVSSNNLRKQFTHSCGCLLSEYRKRLSEKLTVQAFGEGSLFHKLSEVEVRRIHELAAQGLSAREIKTRINKRCGGRNISHILAGKRWPHIHPEIKGASLAN
jgi:hypothetical protein